jgi:hypothetical protein
MKGISQTAHIKQQPNEQLSLIWRHGYHNGQLPPLYDEVKFPQTSALNKQIRHVHKLYIKSAREMYKLGRYSPTARANVTVAFSLLKQAQAIFGMDPTKDDSACPANPENCKLSAMVREFFNIADVPFKKRMDCTLSTSTT